MSRRQIACHTHEVDSVPTEDALGLHRCHLTIRHATLNDSQRLGSPGLATSGHNDSPFASPIFACQGSWAQRRHQTNMRRASRIQGKIVLPIRAPTLELSCKCHSGRRGTNGKTKQMNCAETRARFNCVRAMRFRWSTTSAGASN